MDSQTASPIVEILTKVLTPQKKPKLFEQVYNGYWTPVRVDQVVIEYILTYVVFLNSYLPCSGP